MPKPSTRHYIVRNKAGDAVALIEATSVAQSRSHFVHKNYTVALATSKDVIEACNEGIKEEKAGEESSPDEGVLEFGGTEK
jgi:hypothetical protein